MGYSRSDCGFILLLITKTFVQNNNESHTHTNKKMRFLWQDGTKFRKRVMDNIALS